MSEVISPQELHKADKICTELAAEGLSNSSLVNILATALLLALSSTDQQVPYKPGLIFKLELANKFDLEVTKQGEVS